MMTSSSSSPSNGHASFTPCCCQGLHSAATKSSAVGGDGKDKFASRFHGLRNISAAFLYSLLIWITWHSANESSLPPSEVATLQRIGKSLGKVEWNFSANPCAGEFGWITNFHTDRVTCDCSFSNETICHVTSIVLKYQNLQGFLPPELAELPFIQEIVLERNYLSGTIPPQWGSTRLLIIILFGNRLSGSIPKEIGNISTLLWLALDMNLLSGPLPPELGSLTSLQKMHLTSNNFTGEIPATFAKLTALEEFRLGDNLLSGKVPDFIPNWIHLKRLQLQGSGLAGPIPPGISLLANLTDLRITDLKGTEEVFPTLVRMKLNTLILRSCNIVGELPRYLGNMTRLKALDLSFNRLSGPIPDSFSSLIKTDYMYFTGNYLNGTVPAWMLKSGDVDLSYNNFTLSNTTSVCKLHKPNIFGNPLVSGTVGSAICSRDICPTTYGSFSINCGGDSFSNGSLVFDSDTSSAEAADFYVSPTNWAWSSTGHYLDDNSLTDRYTVHDRSRGTSDLDMDARISAISLTYYGFCLLNGRYNIDLYFSEIEFSNDRTYSSLGRRVFDIYIQGNLVIKDFNIAAEAGGASKRIIKNFSSWVSNGTLEIRLQWAGKGTTALPKAGVYGPLISAISATNPDVAQSTNSGLSTGAKIGIAVSVVLVLSSLATLLWWKWEFCVEKIRKKDELRGLELQTGSYTSRQLQAATNNFDPANKIGEGGFGPVFKVYKGHLADGTAIAVKQLSAKSKQGNREFVNEIGTISALQHPNLVKLYGCCIEGNQLSLVYEYMVNNNLARALFAKSEQSKLHLDWPARYKICTGIARGLAYLHEESPLKIVHRDIKATNVLLDADLTPKISDFGLAKLDEEVDSHISTRIAGTVGYIAPEYAMRGYLTDKADIYSFGVLALEIVSGKSNTTWKKDDGSNLLEWARVQEQKGQLMDVVDPILEGKFKKNEVMTTIKVGLQCAKVSPSERPKMSLIVGILEGKYSINKLQLDPTNIASSSSGP